MGEGLQAAIRATRRTRITDREMAVLKALTEAEGGATGPELAHVARRFGARSVMFEWAGTRLRALEEMGYATRGNTKRHGAWIWQVTEDGRKAAKGNG